MWSGFRITRSRNSWRLTRTETSNPKYTSLESVWLISVSIFSMGELAARVWTLRDGSKDTGWRHILRDFVGSMYQDQMRKRAFGTSFCVLFRRPLAVRLGWN